MTSFVAISHAALAAAGRDPSARLAVLDLYERAHRTGYAPRAWTERELGEEWGVDRKIVVRILQNLEAAGCIEVERAPSGSRRPSVLRVICPTRQAGTSTGTSTRQNGNQTRNQTSNQNDADTTPDSLVQEPVREPVQEPGAEPDFAKSGTIARADKEPCAQRLDQTRPDQTEQQVSATPQPTPPPLRLLEDPLTPVPVATKPKCKAPPKPRNKAPDPRTLSPDERQFGDAWSRAWKASGRADGYPWFIPGADAFLLRAAATACGYQPPAGPTPEQVLRLERAAAAYITAADAGNAFPKGDPPTLHFFSRDAAKWIQLGSQTQPKPLTGKHAHDPPPAPPEPVMDAAAKAEAARRFLEIQERRKAEEAKRLRRQQGGG